MFLSQSLQELVMTIAVTDAEIKDIIKTDRADLTSFISMADLVITENLSDGNMSDARLKQIKVFLSAHYIAIADGEFTREKMGDGEVDYADRMGGFGFHATRWGRQAIALDETNVLEEIDEEDIRSLHFSVV